VVSGECSETAGGEPEISEDASIDLTGTMNELVRQATIAKIAINDADETTLGTGPPPWGGLVHQITPTLNLAVLVAHRDFDRLWKLALADNLKYAHIEITKPSSHRAYVLFSCARAAS
jgi:hypothetical protein